MKKCLFLGDEKVVNDEFLSLLNKQIHSLRDFKRYGYDCLAEKNADGSGFIYEARGPDLRFKSTATAGFSEYKTVSA